MSSTSSIRKEAAAPFLKWAGGKSQLLKQYANFFPAPGSVNRYYEPFIGSAAVFFCLQPPRACLSDVNDKLIEVYRVVQQDVESLIQHLSRHRNEKSHYYQVRAQRPDELSPVERAARLIFLNKTCYNGLYRENRKGEFNVPFGRYKNPTICDPDRLRAASLALSKAELRVADFSEIVDSAEDGDFVYFDPPYVPLSPTSSFTSYNRHGFNADDQLRLSKNVDHLTSKGCRVMLSNSSASLVYDLYARDEYKIVEINARRSINSRPNGRGPVKELLILNYDPGS